MKRLALLLLLLATPALAGRLLVVRGTIAAGKDSQNQRAAQAWFECLNTMKVAYDVMPQSAVPTLYLKNGVVPISNTLTRAYSAALLLDYEPAYAGGNFAPGFNPDSLTRSFYRSAIPLAFVGRVSLNSSSQMAQDTSQTTRPQTGVGTIGSYLGPLSAYSQQLVGSDLVWKSWDCGFIGSTSNGGGETRVANSNSASAGYVRVVIAARATSATGYGLACSDCDDMVRMGQATADSVAMLWEHYTVDSRGWPTGPPNIFAWPQAGNGSSSQDIPHILTTIALLDSATGGALVGSAGAFTPKKLAFYIGHAFSRSTYTAANLAEGGALNCDGQNCVDSTAVKASIDSLVALKVPLTIGVNVDSIASFPYEKQWWKRLGANARYAPEPWNGWLTSPNSGRTSRFLAADPFGANRSRQLITPNRYCCAEACDGIDTTLSCVLSYARARIDSIPEFAGRAARALVAPGFDYVDLARTREQMPNPDSLAAAMWRSGFKVAVLSMIAFRSAPSATWALTGAGADWLVAAGTQASLLGLRAHQQRVDVLASGVPVGSFYWAACRGITDADPSAAARGLVSTHPVHNEFLMGAYMTSWYPDDPVYYYHSFKTSLDVLTTRVGELGQTGLNGTAVRSGFYHIKWTVNSMRAVQALSWPGHQPAQFVFAEDL